MDDYLASCEAGQPLTADELAARYPELSEQVADCLASLEFIRRAAAGGSVGTANGAVGNALCGVPDSPLPLGEGGSRSEPGEGTLGDFRILREIGRGGMGVVYEAEQISLQRRVALKVLPFAAVLDSKQLARFKNEALAAASLDHPHIVDVLGVGCDRGMHFYAMRLIDGCTLADVIAELRSQESGARSQESGTGDQKTGAVGNALRDVPESATNPTLNLEPETLNSSRQSTAAVLTTLGLTDTSRRTPDHYRKIAALIADAADALHHAHEQGVIHRDIKPSNLMLDSRGKLWVTDFGLAHVESNTTLTMTGDLMGTLRYMSPEQATGSRLGIDHRTDIYSLGVTLYELLTLQPAFTGENRAELLRQIMSDDPSAPRKHDASIPADLETIVLKALAKEPADRYTTAADLAGDLRRYYADEQIRALPPTLGARAAKWTRRHQRMVAASIIALCLAATTFATTTAIVWHQRRLAESRRAEADANLQEAVSAIDGMLQRVAAERLFDQPQMEPVRRALLEDALKLYTRLIERSGNRPELERQRAQAHRQLGELLQTLGDNQRAVEELSAAITTLQALTARDPGDQEALRSLARAQRIFGTVLEDLGRPDEAGNAFKAAVAEYSRLATIDPADNRLGLATAIESLALHFANRGRTDEADAQYGEAQATFERLAAANPADPSFQHSLAHVVHLRAMLWIEAGDANRAEPAMRKAVHDLEKMVKSYPQNSQIIVTSAHLSNNLAVLLIKEKRYAEAVPELERALIHQNHLVARFPDRIDYQEELVLGQSNFGGVLRYLKRYEQAEPYYDDAIARMEKLVAKSPNIPRLQSYLADFYKDRGHVRFDRNKVDEAAQDYLAALDVIDELLRNFPPDEPSAKHFVGRLGALADRLTAVGEHRSAERAAAVAASLRKTSEQNH
jgi:serine/threonine protein kinase